MEIAKVVSKIAQTTAERHSWYKHLPLLPTKHYYIPCSKWSLLGEWDIVTVIKEEHYSPGVYQILLNNPIFVNCFLRGTEVQNKIETPKFEGFSICREESLNMFAVTIQINMNVCPIRKMHDTAQIAYLNQ